VLYIADFDYNMTFVSQSTFGHNLKLAFFSKTCIIQDIQTKERIGVVDAKFGLYAICVDTDLSCYLNITAINNITYIWRLRTIHLSTKRPVNKKKDNILLLTVEAIYSITLVI